VFAATSLDGFLYIFDLSVSTSAPVNTLEAPAVTSTQDGHAQGQRASGMKSNKVKRIGLTGLAFNKRQRDLVAAIDLTGRVHIWRLSWGLSNRQKTDQAVLDALGNVLGETD